MNNNKKVIWTIAGLLAVVVILLGVSRFSDPNRDIKKKWAAGDVECIDGHQNLAWHIHPILKVFVDGQEEIIPNNVGIVSSCMAEVHTHDSSGTIHVETAAASRRMYLRHFLVVWGKTLERDGYNLEMTVNGSPSGMGGDLLLEDKQEIILNYFKKDN